MKKTLIIFLKSIFWASVFTGALFVFTSAVVRYQVTGTDMARVQKKQGIPIFIRSEPVTPYEVTGKVTNDDALTWANALTGDETGRGLDENIDVLLNNANRKAKKGKFSFDAIITDDGNTGTCIKFKE